MLEIEKFIEGVHDYISRALSPLASRVKALEERATVPGPKGDAGERGEKGMDGAAGAAGPRGESGEKGESGAKGEKGDRGEAGLPGRDGRDGKDAPAVDTEALAAAVLAKIPPPKDGRDGRDGVNGKDGAPGVNGKDGEPGAAGKDGAPGRDGANGADGARGEKGDPGRDGKDADPGVIKALIEEGIARELPNAVHKVLDVMLPMIVQRAADLVPRPADGKDGAPGRDGERGEPGQPGEKGAEGKSITVDDIRPVLEGEIAKGVLDLERRATDVLQRAVERIEPPKDGRDGLSLDDFDAKMAGRTLTLSMRCGDRTVERALKMDIPLDKGVFRKGQSYEKSDVITYGGSQWIALKDTSASPPHDDWRLQVRKGADGKDAP